MVSWLLMFEVVYCTLASHEFSNPKASLRALLVG